MRFNHLLHLIAFSPLAGPGGFPGKAHGIPPASGVVIATKMPDSCALSKSSDQFQFLHTLVSGRGRGQALACSPAPEGHDHWTLRLPAGKAVEPGLVESLSHETVRLRLKKTRSSRGGSNNGASRR